MNYFFGQNVPGPLAGSTVVVEQRSSTTTTTVSTTTIAPVGRDVYGGEPTLQSGLMAPKRTTLEGNNAAFDMKSLGKHIEAVGVSSHSSPSYFAFATPSFSDV